MAQSLRRARPDQRFCVAPGESCCPAVHIPVDRRGTQLLHCLGAARTSLCGDEPGFRADSFRRHPLQRESHSKPSRKIELIFVLRALGDTCMAAGRPGEAAVLRGLARALAARRYASGYIIVLQFQLGQAEVQLAAGDVAAAQAELEAILAEPEQPGASAIRVRARELQAAARERRR